MIKFNKNNKSNEEEAKTNESFDAEHLEDNNYEEDDE